MARRSAAPRPRHSAERIYVAISILALIVAVLGVVLGVRTSTADFIVITTTPGNTLTTLIPQPPGTSPAGTLPAGVVRLTWSASATEATHTVTYSVYRRPTGVGSYVLIAGPFSVYTYDDTPPSDASYDYVVRANVSSFSSDDSTVRVGLSDRTAPVSSLTCNGSACSSSTWYAAAISVVLSASDAGSGVATVSRSVDGGATTTGASPASFTVSGDSATHSVAHYATDVAGNVSGSATQTLKIDTTVPTISGAATPAPNGAGWRNTDVTVTYTCNDTLSGIASCTAPVTLSTDGSNLSSSGTAVDNAGNSAGTSVTGINLDKTAPSTVSGLTATQGALLGPATVELSWTAATDATSGVSGYTVRWVQAGTCPAASVANYPSSASIGVQTTYTITGSLLAQYCAYLLTHDVAGNTSAASAVAGPATAR